MWTRNDLLDETVGVAPHDHETRQLAVHRSLPSSQSCSRELWAPSLMKFLRFLRVAGSARAPNRAASGNAAAILDSGRGSRRPGSHISTAKELATGRLQFHSGPIIIPPSTTSRQSNTTVPRSRT